MAEFKQSPIEKVEPGKPIYIPGSMTDKQALDLLGSMQLTLSRGSAKSIFQNGMCEAILHAYLALKEKVEGSSEQPTGEWIRKEDSQCYWFECSHCGNRPLGWHEIPMYSEFCPFCGAKMKEGEAE